jgi:hypothetical protein
MTQRVRSRCSVRGRLSSSPSDANIMLGRIGSYGRRWSQARHEVYSAVCVGSLTGVMPMRLQQTQFTTVATRLPTTVWVPNTRSTPRMTLDVPSWIAQKQLYFPARKITKPRHQRQQKDSNSLLQVFMVSNTLAFCLAMASVMLVVVPTLPMPQE